MEDPQPLETDTIYVGEKASISYIVNGRKNFKSVLKRLKSKDKREHTKIMSLIRSIGGHGVPRNPQKSIPVSSVDGLFELKTTRARMPYFYWKGKIVITHVFLKKGKTTPQSEFIHAKELKKGVEEG